VLDVTQRGLCDMQSCPPGQFCDSCSCRTTNFAPAPTRRGTDGRLTVTDVISAEMIRDLVTPDFQLLAIRVPAFLPPEVCEKLAARLRGNDEWERYADPSARGIGTLGGKALFDCAGKTECDNYFATADSARDGVRKLLLPYVNPSDLIQAKLDEAWEAGCGLMKIAGRRANKGLIRSFEAGGEALPHTDRSDWDFPCPETMRVAEQLAVNCYLSQAAIGGELELWTLRPTREEYNALRDGASYGLRRDLLPSPEVIIRPNPGDLIVFSASRVHAVRPSTGGGARVTVSGFVAYSGPDDQLRIFS
jgi:hypothetical protein